MTVLYGTAKWAYIKTPNTRFTPEWCIDLAPENQEDLDNFKDKGFTIKTHEGVEHLKIRRKVTNAKGNENSQPKLLDAHKNPIDVQVGNGSRVAVQFEEYSGTGSYVTYQGLDLKAVQVLDLVEFAGADGDEFDSFDPDSEL